MKVEEVRFELPGMARPFELRGLDMSPDELLKLTGLLEKVSGDQVEIERLRKEAGKRSS